MSAHLTGSRIYRGLLAALASVFLCWTAAAQPPTTQVPASLRTTQCGSSVPVVGTGAGLVEGCGANALGSLAYFSLTFGNNVAAALADNLNATGGVLSYPLNLNSGAVSGTLQMANGGLGAATFTQYGVLVGEGSNSFHSIETSTPGLCLLSSSSADPVWGSCNGTSSVSGPGSTVNGDVAAWNGLTGTVLSDSGFQVANHAYAATAIMQGNL